MPLKVCKIIRNLAEQEGRILLAILALKKNEISTVTRAAQIFNVPCLTLRDWLKGSKYRNEIRPNGHKMTQNKEESLIRWILSMDQRGVAP
jgi:hypothetical protein